MNHLNEFADQMQRFRASDEAREQFVSEILVKYKTLSGDHVNLQNDYLSERDNRRNYQRAADERQALLQEYESQLESSSFILALIDGDGAVFQDALLKAAGGDGGSEAASRLYQAIRNHVASLYNNSGNWNIMVQVYLSLDKLAIKLAHVGLLGSWQELRVFAQRFNINQPLFSVIDVGQGKERADHKIKEMLRTFSNNPTCRHIIFGGCHDSGYLLNLEQFKHNTHKASRITLLETTPAYRGFADLANFQHARFDDVFRKDPLPDYVPSLPNGNTAIQQPLTQSSAQHTPGMISPPPGIVQPPPGIALPPAGVVQPPPGLGQPSSSLVQPSTAKPPVIRTSTNTSPAVTPKPAVVSPSTKTTPPTSGDPTGDPSWAAVGKANGPTKGNISIVPTNSANSKTATKKKYVYYNKEEQRLDEPLPTKDPAAAASLEARMKKTRKNMCNNFHIGGFCENGKFCGFQHEPRLSPAELNALRYKTRSLPCKDRYCINFDCYLGHQCAYERDTGYCSYPDTCHFRSTHGMDKVKFVRYDKEGNADYAP